jgi:hypothetical protein
MVWTKSDERRWRAVEALVRDEPEVFAVQGTVQSSGNCHHLRYRDGDAQRSVYLGRSQELADRVAELLRSMQWAEQSRRVMKRLCRDARRGTRQCLADIDDLLDRCGEPATPFDSDDEMDEADDTALDGVQEPWLPAESLPTGGKPGAAEAAFLEGVLPTLSQDQVAQLLNYLESMTPTHDESSRASNNSQAINSEEGNSAR